MSHKIIIRSSSASLNNSNEASIISDISYEPPHHQGERSTLKRIGKIMRLVKQIEDIVDSPDDQES